MIELDKLTSESLAKIFDALENLGECGYDTPQYAVVNAAGLTIAAWRQFVSSPQGKDLREKLARLEKADE